VELEDGAVGRGPLSETSSETLSNGEAALKSGRPPTFQDLWQEDGWQENFGTKPANLSATGTNGHSTVAAGVSPALILRPPPRPLLDPPLD
jgi:hypothetical protein